MMKIENGISTDDVKNSPSYEVMQHDPNVSLLYYRDYNKGAIDNVKAKIKKLITAAKEEKDRTIAEGKIKDATFLKSTIKSDEYGAEYTKASAFVIIDSSKYLESTKEAVEAEKKQLIEKLVQTKTSNYECFYMHPTAPILYKNTNIKEILKILKIDIKKYINAALNANL